MRSVTSLSLFLNSHYFLCRTGCSQRRRENDFKNVGLKKKNLNNFFENVFQTFFQNLFWFYFFPKFSFIKTFSSISIAPWATAIIKFRRVTNFRFLKKIRQRMYWDNGQWDASYPDERPSVHIPLSRPFRLEELGNPGRYQCCRAREHGRGGSQVHQVRVTWPGQPDQVN